MPLRKSNDVVSTSKLWSLLFTQAGYSVFIPLLLIVELVLGILIIKYVKYTEIDWIAYMDEVKGFLDGDWDYMNLKGDTGPLVYPGGFVYIFSLLYYITDGGKNIVLGQYIFLVIYLLSIFIIMRIYKESNCTHPYVLIFLCISKRLHSIFMLRLFNDAIALLIFYVSMLFFIKQKWLRGCIFYSLAVSVKMNIFLFAPALFLLLLENVGLYSTVMHIAVCGIIQLLIGLPFLSVNPFGYLLRSFELGRVFFFKWTVNWKFLPEEIFLSKSWAYLLLLLTIIFWLIFAYKAIKGKDDKKNRKINDGNNKQSVDRMILLFFVSNFIGMVFARSIHYQFYCWYFLTLPYLLWKTSLHVIIKVALLGAIEYSFNVFPATFNSSLILLFAHLIILISLLFVDFKKDNNEEKKNK